MPTMVPCAARQEREAPPELSLARVDSPRMARSPDMDPGRWRRVAHLSELALEREPADRGAFLATISAGDDELRREVESLIAHDDVPALIDRPMLDAAAAVLGDSGELSTRSASRRPGTDAGNARSRSFATHNRRRFIQSSCGCGDVGSVIATAALTEPGESLVGAGPSCSVLRRTYRAPAKRPTTRFSRPPGGTESGASPAMSPLLPVSCLL